MITNFFTLFHLANEFNQEFSGCHIQECYTQYRSELIISFRETEAVLLVGCEPSDNYIYSKKTFARARRNSISIFPRAQGLSVVHVSLHPTDRQIFVQLDDSSQFVIQMFGSRANVFLIQANGEVTGQFLKKGEATDQRIELPSREEKSSRPQITRDDLLTMDGDRSIFQALKQILPHYGPVLIQEILFRAHISSDRIIADLQNQEIETLLSVIPLITDTVLHSITPRIYYTDTAPTRFSLIPLHHLENVEEKTFQSVSEAIIAFRAQVRHEKTYIHEKDGIVKILRHELDHAEKKLHTLTGEINNFNNADQYETFGKLLIAHLHLFKKGDTSVVVENYEQTPPELVEIPLDGYLTPSKNAERYFAKAEKARHARIEVHKRIADLSHRKNSLVQLLALLQDAVTMEDVREFIHENEHSLLEFGWKKKASGKGDSRDSIPFRVFVVAGGFHVWAGKNGENNDLLSTRHTAKNDLWFHARGAGGSHVVLKVGTGKGEVSKQAIEQAAGIAAYYSKLKNSKLVPVSMCEGKYVRKPKGVPAGTVTIEREKTIFAEPGLPQSSS